MTLAEFREAFSGEDEHVEFKTGVGGAQLQDTAVAFSNAEGGVVLIGVRDDGTIAGRALDAGTQGDIHRAMQNARDVGRYSIAQVDVDGRVVCVLSVARRREGFAQTSGGVVKGRSDLSPQWLTQTAGWSSAELRGAGRGCDAPWVRGVDRQQRRPCRDRARSGRGTRLARSSRPCRSTAPVRPAARHPVRRRLSYRESSSSACCSSSARPRPRS